MKPDSFYGGPGSRPLRVTNVRVGTQGVFVQLTAKVSALGVVGIVFSQMRLALARSLETNPQRTCLRNY